MLKSLFSVFFFFFWGGGGGGGVLKLKTLTNNLKHKNTFNFLCHIITPFKLKTNTTPKTHKKKNTNSLKRNQKGQLKCIELKNIEEKKEREERGCHEREDTELGFLLY
jgi:hypothetical protein